MSAQSEPTRSLALRLALVLMFATACGCVPEHPFIEAADDPWPLAGARIDSLTTQGALDSALVLAAQRRREAESGLQPLWRCLEAREVERVLRQRRSAPAAQQQALAGADREAQAAARLFDHDSLAAASEAGRAALATRSAILGADALPAAEAALALAETEFRQSHAVASDSLAVIAGAAFARCLGPGHPRLADVVDLRGRIAKNFHGTVGRELTMPSYEQVLRERTRCFGPAAAECSAVLQEIGNLDRMRHQSREAAGMLRAALTWRGAGMGNGRDPRLRDAASIQSSLAVLGASQGAYADAEHFARAAVRATPPGDIDPLAFRIGLHGLLLVRLGRWREAEPVLRRAVALRESLWAMSEQDESSVVTSGLLLHRELANALAAQGHPEAAFAELQRSLSRTLSARQLGAPAIARDPWAGLLPRVQAALPVDVALVTWSHPLAANRYDDFPFWACVVRSSGAPHWFRLDRRARVTAAGFTSRERLLGELGRAAAWPLRVTDTTAIRSMQREMCDEWFTPLEPALTGARRIIVCSPEMVNGAPLGVLIDTQGRTLADRFVISYTPSALFFVGQREQPRVAHDVGTSPALIVGDPAYTTQDPGHWPRLSGTRDEAHAVREALGGGTLLLEAEASAARLRALARSGELARYATLHIASHASADYVHPLESALVLAPDVPGGTLDSRLSAREIANVWHIDADLVSLASCRSAVGALSPTDGWSGLQSAFLIAGARSLLVSLWPADDHATTILMRAFYSRLTDRAHPCDRAEALQAAQQALRAWRTPDGSRPYVHPAYWATFALMGDPR